MSRLITPLIRGAFILLLVIIGRNAYAIPSDPCSCSSHIVVGTDGTTTNYSTLLGGIASNTCYLIRGRLSITSSVNWNQVRLEMNVGSEIYIGTGGNLTINDSYISSCDNEMWKGIYAHTSTGLNVLGSIIQGANFGIYLNSGVRFQCINNDFVNNYIGIAVGDPFLDDQFDRVIYQRAPIRGCEFYTSTNLPSPYPGHYYYPSWPITPTGVPFNKGFAAIFISGAAGLNVGYISATSTNRNKIYQMRNGIILRNAVSDISGTDFYDFEGQVPKNQANLILDHLQDHVNLEMNQVAIHTSRGDLNVKTCTFEDLKIGYYSFNSSQHLQNNTMDISDLSGSLSLTRVV